MGNLQTPLNSGVLPCPGDSAYTVRGNPLVDPNNPSIFSHCYHGNNVTLCLSLILGGLGVRMLQLKSILTTALFTHNSVQQPFTGLEGRWFLRVNTADGGLLGLVDHKSCWSEEVGRGQRRIHLKWDKETKRGKEQECLRQQWFSMSSKRWARKAGSCTK